MPRLTPYTAFPGNYRTIVSAYSLVYLGLLNQRGTYTVFTTDRSHCYHFPNPSILVSVEFPDSSPPGKQLLAIKEGEK